MRRKAILVFMFISLSLMSSGLFACKQSSQQEEIKFIAATSEQQKLCLPDMVYVPAGEFMMGCNKAVDNNCQPDEKPYHKVYLDAFQIDKYDVTNEQYGACVKTGQCGENKKFDGFTDPKQPVVGVDWNQADTYCEWAGKKLPTEAQWEKTARGTDGRIYPWGNQEPTCDLAVFSSGGDGCAKNTTGPVGSKPNGASPYGAMDMAGNVWNWVSDWYDANYYQNSPSRNPTGPSAGDYHVCRGGSWGYTSNYLRSSNRLKYTSLVSRSRGIGFRCARTP